MATNEMTKLDRMEAAIKLAPLDRIPCAPLMDVFFPSKHLGIPMSAAVRDWDAGFGAIQKIYDEVGGWDGMILPGYSLAATPHPYSGIAVGKSLMPGSDLDDDTVIQFDEREVLTRDDYDEIIDLGWNQFRVKHKKRFNPAPESKLLSWAKTQMERYQNEIITWKKSGVRSLCGAIVSSPLMILSTSRTLMEVTRDIFEIPDKLEAAMGAMVDDLISDSIEAAQLSGEPGVMLIMERGGCFYYSLSIYERFEYPFMKKMVDAFADAGMITVMHLDQSHTENLPYFKNLPSKMVVAELDSTTDIFKAKDVLEGHICIAGDVPAALLTLGEPSEVEDYCKKLISEVGRDGGFILSTGCTCPSECRMDNFRAMIETAKNYYPHG